MNDQDRFGRVSETNTDVGEDLPDLLEGFVDEDLVEDQLDCLPGLAPAPAVLSREQKSLAEQHLDLVRHVVFQVAVNFPRHVDRDELEGAGSLGLVEAAGRYDESRGVPFERFAAQRIRGAIIDHVRGADWAPRSVRHLAREVERVEHKLAVELSRSPTDDEVAKAMRIPLKDLEAHRVKVFKGVVLALEYDVNDGDEDLTLVEVLADLRELDPFDQIEGYERMSIVRDAIELLPERHRYVTIAYFLDKQTSENIAKELGVTISRVSQLRTEAIDRIRYAVEAQYKEDEEGKEEDDLGLAATRLRVYADSVSRASSWQDRLTIPQMTLPDASAAPLLDADKAGVFTDVVSTDEQMSIGAGDCYNEAMSTSEQATEDPIDTFERIAAEATVTQSLVIAELGKIGSEGADEEQLGWLGRLSDSVEAIEAMAETIHEAIGEVPTRPKKPTTDVPKQPRKQSRSCTPVGHEEVSTVLGFFLTHDKARLGDLKRENPDVASDINADKFRRIRTQVSERLGECGVQIEWEVTGQTRGTRYSMQILEGAGKLEELLVAPEQAQEVEASEKEDDLLEAETEKDSGPEDLEDFRKEVKIRGESNYFTLLEYRIMGALLDGPKSTQQIIAHLQGGVAGWAEPDFYNKEFVPALDRLKRMMFDDESLVRSFSVEDGGNRYMRFKLPDGARIEVRKKDGQETLRFTNRSTFVGAPNSRPKGLARKEAEPQAPADTKPPKAPAAVPSPKTTVKTVKTEGLVSVSGSTLIDQSGKEIKIEPQTRAILEVLSSGQRLTVAEVAKMINPDYDGDSTFNNVVAGELARIQSQVGATSLRRKQKKGQPARWWLEIPRE